MKSKIYQDAFDQLDLMPRFNINLNELEKNYMNALRKCNPDRYFPQSSAQQSAKKQILDINRSYVQIVCPMSRLVLLLHRMNMNIIAEIDSSFLNTAYKFGEEWAEKISAGQVVKVQKDLLEALKKSYALAIDGWERGLGELMVRAYQEMNVWINMAQNLNIDWQEKQLQEIFQVSENQDSFLSSIAKAAA